LRNYFERLGASVEFQQRISRGVAFGLLPRLYLLGVVTPKFDG
jgi:hypothetical protein